MEIKQDNTNLNKKVNLRIKYLNKNKIYNVLDCFHGEGLIWNNIIQQGYNINLYSIDLTSSATIKGNNKNILKNIDINEYDIIDLDDYGMPIEQLYIISQKLKKDIIIFFTCCMIRRNAPQYLMKLYTDNKNIQKLAQGKLSIKLLKNLLYKAILKMYNGYSIYIDDNGVKIYGVIIKEEQK